MDITMTADNEVRQGPRVIGFVRLFTIRGESAWRFIANRRDISERYPVPSPKFATAEGALADVRVRLGK